MTEAPPHAFAFRALHRTAARVLADREAAYPAYVEKGQMTGQDAATGIRHARSLEADWRRIVDLRAGREAAPIDATATSYEKLILARYVHDRAVKLRIKAWAELRAPLEHIGALHAVETGLTHREALRDAVRYRFPGWPHQQIEDFLAAERNAWLTEGLVYHAERWPLPMIYAEVQAGWIAERKAATAEVAAA
jgi:hypothetical protein